MSLRPLTLAVTLALSVGLAACQPQTSNETTTPQATQAPADESSDIAAKVAAYEEVELTADLSHLAEGDRQAIVHLLEASEIMDALFWKQAHGDRDALLAGIDDPATRRFVEINYGPWDRLDGGAPFVAGVGPRPPGANFYPADMTKEEFEAADLPGKDGLYTLVRRNEAGELVVVPYHEEYAEELGRAAELLREAAKVATDEGFRNYLQLRADALLSGDYQPSDMAWMDMKTSPIDVVIGPIESYEDGLFGTKTAFEAFVLVKDVEWSERLAKFAQHLPALQRGLPVEARYKAESPGSDADLNAYDAIYYAGDANAGAKTIAINLPNDEQVQLAKGSRRLQLKNAMRAKFDAILLPLADELIVPEQRERITFDAFFENVMFHEVAHGLGIKNTLGGEAHRARGAVRPCRHAGGRQGRRAGPVHDRPARGDGRAGRGEAGGQLRHLPRRHLPLGALRRQQRPRPGQHGRVQLPPGTGRVHPRRRNRPLPRALRPDEAGGGRAVLADPHPAGRRRPRRRPRLPRPLRQGRPGTAGGPGPHRPDRHPGGHRVPAGARGAGAVGEPKERPGHIVE
jgi:hypothetical protein